MSCDRCNVTYYCGKEHQVIDWHGIHEKICPLLAPLRNAPPIVSSEDERLRRNLTVKMSQVYFLGFCENVVNVCVVGACNWRVVENTARNVNEKQ